MKCVAIIPARGGSKGIPLKNIVDVCGKPLIAYTIGVAREANQLSVIDDVIVSTDSTEIAEIAIRYGAKAPFLRPKEIAGDTAKSSDAVLHAVRYLEFQGAYYDTVLTLLPTAPLRMVEDIKKGLEIYQKHSEKSLISCYQEEGLHDIYLYHCSNGIAIPLNNAHNREIRRQDANKLYIRNGALYITDIEYLKRTKKLVTDKPIMYEMPKHRSINIDRDEDLIVLRKIICGSNVSSDLEGNS